MNYEMYSDRLSGVCYAQKIINKFPLGGLGEDGGFVLALKLIQPFLIISSIG